MPKKLLLLPLAAALLLASCGGTSTPTPTTPPTTTTTDELLTSDGTATAARSFVLSAFKPGSAGAGLGAQSLQQQDTANLSERLRVVLSVERIKTGASAGQRRATVRVIWATPGVKLAGPLSLTLTDQQSRQTLRTKSSKLALSVTGSDFQTSKTLSTSSILRGNNLCARVGFTLTASSGPVFDTVAAPLEVCEDEAALDTTIKALTTAAAKAMNTRTSTALAPFKVQAFPGVLSFPSDSELKNLLGVSGDLLNESEALTLPAGLNEAQRSAVYALDFVRSSLDNKRDMLEMFGRVTNADPNKDPVWTRYQRNQKALEALAQTATVYGLPLRAYTWETAPGRTEAALVGLTSGGAFAVRTVRYGNAAPVEPPTDTSAWPLSTAVKTSASFGRGSLYVYFDHVRDGVNLSTTYSIAPALACGAAADGGAVWSGKVDKEGGSMYGWATAYADGIPTDDGLQVSYTVTISHPNDTARTFTGKLCAGEGLPTGGGDLFE